MFIGLMRNASVGRQQPATDDTDVIVPFPHPKTIDEALGNLQALEGPDDMDPYVRRAMKRQRRKRTR